MFTLSLTRFHGLALICILLAAVFLPGCSRAGSDSEELQRYKTAENIAHSNIATFDNLDFDVFSNQKWRAVLKKAMRRISSCIGRTDTRPRASRNILKI